jgi:hypothetical protein
MAGHPAALRRRLAAAANHLLAQPATAAVGGPLHPELAKRGVTDFSCFDVPAAMTVDERMAQPGATDIDPAVAAALEPIFDMDAPCVRNFDHDKFQRDGYWVWDGIWLPAALRKLVEACHNAQRMNDMYLEGYREKGDQVLSGVPDPAAEYEYLGWENVDWAGLGYNSPGTASVAHFPAGRSTFCG